jgi:hypothetical protein
VVVGDCPRDDAGGVCVGDPVLDLDRGEIAQDRDQGLAVILRIGINCVFVSVTYA